MQDDPSETNYTFDHSDIDPEPDSLSECSQDIKTKKESSAINLPKVSGRKILLRLDLKRTIHIYFHRSSLSHTSFFITFFSGITRQ